MGSRPRWHCWNRPRCGLRWSRCSNDSWAFPCASSYATLDSAGIDVTPGIEEVAATVEREDALSNAGGRGSAAVLLDDLAARRRLVEPLVRLYGDAVTMPPPLSTTERA